MTEFQEVAAGSGWSVPELLGEYARLHAEKKVIEERLEALKTALVEIAEAQGAEKLSADGASMRFKRWRGLEAVERDAVIDVLAARSLLPLFAQMRPPLLHELASTDPTLRADLALSVREVTGVTATFTAPRGKGKPSEPSE